MRVVWHVEAELELIDAARFYEGRVAGLGTDFLAAVDKAVSQIVADPHRFPIVEGEIRRCRVSRFPFSIYFRLIDNTLRILVINHHSRHPDYWKPRKQGWPLQNICIHRGIHGIIAPT
ncbi:MAG: type II toxin-antitoxin system RelE/ParE family toxin [Burkholderiales bacterium]|nr:type II toxin-antitoxin system RelE/ParE family toxin [Burkholderiales bacterium]